MSNSNIIIINHDLVSLFALFCYVGARRRRPTNGIVFKSWSTNIYIQYIAIEGIGVPTPAQRSSSQQSIRWQTLQCCKLHVASCLPDFARAPRNCN